jgi:hypothetical protein
VVGHRGGQVVVVDELEDAEALVGLGAEDQLHLAVDRGGRDVERELGDDGSSMA